MPHLYIFKLDIQFENLFISFSFLFSLFSIQIFVENIWHTELDFLVPHRDRLVILSFATSPYQNNSVHEENYGKQHQQHQQPHQNHRPMFIDDDDELAHTHLIEKFHSGTFDENDYFDTHEKLENERTTTLLMTTSSPVTVPSNNYNSNNNHGMYNDTNKNVKTTTTPSILTNTESNEKQQLYVENSGTHTNVNNNNNNNRRQQTRMRNRNNGMAGGRGSNRKNSNGNRENASATATAAAAGGQSNRREKYNRRLDDLRENFETKVNNNLESEKGGVSGGGEFGEKGAANTKSQRKYVTKIDTSDELPPDNEFELNAGNRKSSTVRDSNIHIVKHTADTGTFVPSTPYSTDSKIIEIKPSTVRTSKRIKRSSETINTRMQIDSDGMEDEFGDLVDEDIEPRIFVNFENDEQYVENDESSLNPAAVVPDAVAAALIDNTVVPANVTPITTTTTTSKQLHGFVGCLQHYLKVDKEIGKREFSITNTYISLV